MPSTQFFGWSSSPQSPLSLRVGATVVVVAIHISVMVAIMWAPAEQLEKLESNAVMVSMIDAPTPEMTKAEPASAPQQTAQKTKPELLPRKEPELKPEPVVDKAPDLSLKPKFKSRSKPKAQKAKQEAELKSKSVDVAPSGSPEGADAPKGVTTRGLVSNEPVVLSSDVAYLGGKPNYPEASRRMREEGIVIILVHINTEGIVEQARVDTTSGYTRLDKAALVAARTARFKPLIRNGIAYSAKAKLPFDFVLRN